MADSTISNNEKADEVVKFWLDAGPSAWWRKSDEFDAQIKQRFGDLFEQAAAGELDDWRNEASSCLALILVLDQFSRNLFRGHARAFAQDAQALEVAKHAVEKGFNRVGLEDIKEILDFFHMPFMHSENIEDQQTCLELMRVGGNQGSIKAAVEHGDIIANFGRFPHRNGVLGRQTSEEERAFLDGGGFSG